MIRLDADAFAPRGAAIAALARLEQIDAPELIVVEVGGDAGAGADPRALAELRRLPCLVVAHLVGAVADAAARALVATCDLCLSPPAWAPAATAPIVGSPPQLARRLRELDAQARRPETVVLAMLLRRRDDDVADGLLLESLAYSALQSGATFQAWLAQR